MSATILIVDDEPHARINLTKFLGGIGYETVEAANLTEARQASQYRQRGHHPARSGA